MLRAFIVFGICFSTSGSMVAVSVEHEVGSREGAVGPVRPVEHRDVRLDLTLLNQPCQVRGRSVDLRFAVAN